MNCRRCHRLLKSEKSAKKGIGPVCESKVKRDKLVFQDKTEIPNRGGGYTGDIVCKRTETGKADVNIPQIIVYHSPSGFEWGYGGSGPADLAFNILALYIGTERAERLYQAFKWEFIAKLPHEGGTITKEAICSWIAKVEKVEAI